MKIKSISILLFLLLISCDSKKNNFDKEIHKENVVKLEFQNLRIRIKIPRKHQLIEDNKSVTINLNPQGRNAKQFSIVRLSSNIQKSKYTKSFKFNSGAAINYDTFSKNGGSGGTEYILKGILEFEKNQFLITSIEQNEFKKGEPEFCLKYLSTIEKTNNNVTQTISTDINSLSKLLNFTTYKPVKVKYKYTFIDNSGKNDRISIPGPSDYHLEALLYFDSITFSRINDSIKKIKWIKQNSKKDTFNFNWLPNEISNELMNSDKKYYEHPDFFFGIGVHKKSLYLKNKILIITSSN
jgi:hypothetical protein